MMAPGRPHGQANEELVLYLRDKEAEMDGSSVGVAAALGLLCLALGLDPAPDVVVTGALDLCGRVYGVAGLPGKLQVRTTQYLLLCRSIEWLDIASATGRQAVHDWLALMVCM